MADTNHTLDEGVTGVISKIQLPNGGIYEIHDAKAIHTIAELGLGQALIFKGVKETYAELPTSGNKIGDVWHVKADDYEYVWAQVGDTPNWEEFGAPHNYAAADHTHTVTVKGTNQASTVTGNVTVPTVGSSSKYVKATVSRGATTTDTALGTGATFTTTVTPATTNIKATASGTTVGANGTTTVITGLDSNADSVLGADTTFTVSGGTASTSKMVTTTVKNPSVTAVSIPNVTGNTQVTASKVSNAGSKTNGTAASWSASVSDGILSFSWTTNTPTAVTLPTFSSVTATNTTLGTALSASQVTTSNVTVATGALASNGSGASVATGVSAITVSASEDDLVNAVTGVTPSGTATALTGVKVTKQPTIALATGATAGTGVISVATGISSASTEATGKDTVTAITAVPVPTVTLSKDGTSTDGIALVESVTVGSTTASITNGSAAAQKWTQSSGSTGAPQ